MDICGSFSDDFWYVADMVGVAAKCVLIATAMWLKQSVVTGGCLLLTTVNGEGPTRGRRAFLFFLSNLIIRNGVKLNCIEFAVGFVFVLLGLRGFPEVWGLDNAFGVGGVRRAVTGFSGWLGCPAEALAYLERIGATATAGAGILRVARNDRPDGYP